MVLRAPHLRNVQTQVQSTVSHTRMGVLYAYGIEIANLRAT